MAGGRWSEAPRRVCTTMMDRVRRRKNARIIISPRNPIRICFCPSVLRAVRNLISRRTAEPPCGR